MARKGATNPPPQNQRLNVLFFAAISSAVGGGGRSFSDKTFVEVIMVDSCEIKRSMPALRDGDDVVIGACRSKESCAIVDKASVDGGVGASITAIDIAVTLPRPTRLTKPETQAAIERKERMKTKERVIMATILTQLNDDGIARADEFRTLMMAGLSYNISSLP